MPNATGRADSPSAQTRDIPRWTETYARNRALTRAYMMGLYTVFTVGTVFFAYLGGSFRQQGQAVLMWLCMGLFGLCYAGLGLAVLLQEALQLDRFEQELATTSSSLWGEMRAAIRAAGLRLTLAHAFLWLVAVPLFLLLGRAELRAGNEKLALTWYVAVFVSTLMLIALWAGRRGSRLSTGSQRVGGWLFPAEEGDVVAAPPDKVGLWDYAVGVGFAATVLAMVVLGNMGRLSIEFMQPISALAVVPMLIYGGLRGKRHTGILCWIYAALYGAHALLVVAGAPIQFEGKWQPLNMLMPVCGYGMFSALAAHAYSRWALHKLRGLATVPAESRAREERDRTDGNRQRDS